VFRIDQTAARAHQSARVATDRRQARSAPSHAPGDEEDQRAHADPEGEALPPAHISA
jgi:hypothetical protein